MPAQVRFVSNTKNGTSVGTRSAIVLHFLINQIHALLLHIRVSGFVENANDDY